MKKLRTLLAILAIVIVVGLVATVLIIQNLPQAPDIPSDATHEGTTKCFGCHETGANDAPEFPSWHLDEIERGRITEDVEDCLECHNRAG